MTKCAGTIDLVPIY